MPACRLCFNTPYKNAFLLYIDEAGKTPNTMWVSPSSAFSLCISFTASLLLLLGREGVWVYILAPDVYHSCTHVDETMTVTMLGILSDMIALLLTVIALIELTLLNYVRKVGEMAVWNIRTSVWSVILTFTLFFTHAWTKTFQVIFPAAALLVLLINAAEIESYN